ncbi:sister chromatid cohesion and DNA repair protein [Aaosphaeria arxii CBS 175.79]|uniref:Sister chromatid cohesion and DNA repair protein n=1 Tax=Aaosphaeria arxii CBS 175.79 TaxID=1450172 RepID=A0A6A5XRL9_9PLEO|nr:sister chromatid cohesion and DNA repair protein [Aaosphaeria arxii CBS 175.79]KAF2015391.1 sister chromatid cohesion and DNA repair protein [Aaosphaeria arxii CBS 175.79]
MATRSRRSAATEVVEEEEEQDGVKRLRFRQPLVGKPGRPIGVGDLHTRLKALSEELRGLEQEEAERDSLEPVAKELANQSLLHHKDAGVRAWAACCIVDMFRLCAPDAPYTAAQLKDIFTLIVVKIFPLLADPSHPYNGQHLYVLRCLAEVKSIVLLTDIPSSGPLTSALFTNCFDVLSGPSKADNGEELSKNVEHHMTAVLTILIDEAATLSSDVVDVVVAQFLWADPITLQSGTSKGKKAAQIDSKQSTLRRKEAPPAYNMAKNICNACEDKMARLIGSYFSSVIVDFTSGGSSLKHRDADDSDDERAKGPSDDELNDAIKAHRLLRELWRCAPGVLKDIIPHLQEELGTENIQLRQLATETFGDMISGIGAAGPPARPELNPAAYPSQSLASPDSNKTYNFLTTPTSPKSFPNEYPGAYHSFLQRKHDKAAAIRAAWATAVGRILMTAAGGVGLDPDEEQRLLRSFSESLIDSDERVRLAAVRAIDNFEFDDLVQKLGTNGTMSEPGSVLSNLADRVKDKKSVIHSESMNLLARIWGVAAGAIAEGNERITTLLGPIPSRILGACYVNDPEINVHIDLNLFESLLPLGYPPMKPRAAVNGGSQIVRDSQANTEQGYTEAELDKIRTERMLVLVRGLDERAQKVFFIKQGNQTAGVTYMERFLKLCEDYNGGVMDKDAKEIKNTLGGLINFYGKTLSDSGRAVEDLWKFAKAHDRRSYQLIRFCMAPESDYRKIYKSIKELRKRIEDSSNPALMETLTPLLYRVSLLCYNKSHVPAIIEFSRTDDKGLGAISHEMLKDISTKHPQVFSTHVKDLCKALESEAPTATTPNPPNAVEDLKACASFAKKFPKDVPLNTKDGRKLIQCFMNFALFGSPPKAAKHAITIIISSDNKKELHIKEILEKSIKGFEYGCQNWLTRLAAISQILLLAPQDCEKHTDAIVDIAVNNVLLKAHPVEAEAEVEWMETPDDDMIARTWALQILVNRLRSFPADEAIKDTASPIYAMLNRLVKEGGEASKKKNTPLGHKNLQRLLASNFLLKLSSVRRLDGLLTGTDFNELAFVTHDACSQIRKGFATRLMKYLGQNRLPSRFYTILFLCAYEPNSSLKETILTWLRSRRVVFAARKEIILETAFARLLSLLAHHPDFDTDEDTLKIMSHYILFYLKAVATQDNLSLIFHVAQRVKGVAEGLKPSVKADENLYILSDLSQALIRIWEEQNGWSMQSWPGKLKLPAGIFKPLESHERAQEIADKVWIDEDLVESLEPLVRAGLKGRKRKATDGADKPKKRVKAEKKERQPKAERAIKVPKKKRRAAGSDDDEAGGRAGAASGPRRKSDRRSNAKSYVEISSGDEEDEEEEAGSDEEEDEEVSGESDAGSPEPEAEDVEMANTDEPEEQNEDEDEAPESEPEPTPPPKKSAATRGRGGGKKSNGVASSPPPAPSSAAKRKTPSKASTATTPARSSRTRVQEIDEAESSRAPAAATGSVRRSTRTRS